jgi:tetratricopeptide (TPR) repeat protein
MPHPIKTAVWMAAAILLGACAGRRSITFVVQEPGSQLAVVPMDSPESEGNKIRNPVTMDLATLKNNAVRISATGKASQFWFAAPAAGPRLQIKVKRLGSCEGTESNRNRPTRLILKAYQSLYSKDYQLARELAGRAVAIDNTLAAPHIITGLSFLKEGERQKALASFNQAQALDPEDSEIGALIRTAQ